MPPTIATANATQKMSKSLSGSITSLINPGTRTYFTLEHKTTTEKHRMGETEKILGDYVELGRGDKYAVNFGEDCKTVSRPHAAISKRGNEYLLTPISKSNATLVNGRPINQDFNLQNGDEIQLSNSGPKISFLIPANPSTKSLGFTIRMKAVVNEAIRPYRTTIMVISLIFIALFSGGGYYFIEKGKEKDVAINDLTNKYKQQQKEFQDALAKEEQKRIKMNEELRKKLKEKPEIKPISGFPYETAAKNVFYIETQKVRIELDGKYTDYPYGICGTGFLLNNGKFVTARHVVQHWLFPTNARDYRLSELAAEGAKITMFLTAESSNGTKLELTSDDFTVNDQSDTKKDIEVTFESGEKKTFHCLIAQDEKDGSDWASSKTRLSDGLAFDNSLSTTLKPAAQLHVLGYPFGMGATDKSNIKPRYGKGDVSHYGLENGLIDMSSRPFDTGNSGGPVFAQNGAGNFVVIGIVSAHKGVQGFVVPINAIK